MPGNNKVVWSEGMFLRPQHFQQHDRFIETLVEGRCRGLQLCDRGFTKLQIDQKLLAVGKLAVTECSGIFPDGTPFNLPEDDPLPEPIDIPDDIQNEIVYLGLPARQFGATEIENQNQDESFARFRVGETEIKDSNQEAENHAPVQIGKLKTRLLLEQQERGGYVCLGAARVVELRSDKTMLLDESYIPPVLSCRASSQLTGLIRELLGLLRVRGEALSGRVSEAGRGGVAEIADFMLLQLLNRYEPLFEHFSNGPGLHPESLYRVALQLAGELSTFFRAEKRPTKFPLYKHDDLQTTFSPTMDGLRQSLSMVLEQVAVPIPLSNPKYGIRAAKITDPNLLDNSIFVLAVNAQVSPELLRSRFPNQVKVGPVERIQQLVNSALPGISIHPLPVTPRQIPYHAGFSYFQLNKQSDLWQEMRSSGGFAVHIGGDFPGLELEFWAIKNS